MIEIRTIVEAYEYVKLELAECEDAEFDYTHGYFRDGKDISVFTGRCSSTSPPQEWEFHITQYGVDGYGDGPSEAIDAGQWLIIASFYQLSYQAQMERMFGPELLPIEEAEEFREALVHAVWAIDEVRKLLAGRGGAAQAVWTAQGRELLSRQPVMFTTDFLDQHTRDYQQIGQALADRYREQPAT